MTPESIITLLIGIASMIVSALVYFDKKKQTENQGAKDLVDSALKMVGSIDTLTDRINSVEGENKNLRDQYALIFNENIMLKDRIGLLEKTLLESPVYRMFFELTKFSCLIINSNTGKIFDVNKAFAELYGYSESELLELTVYDLSLEKNETRFAIENKIKHIKERLHRKKDGTNLLVEVHVTYYELNGVNYGLCVYLPRKESSLESRITDLLSNVISDFASDYSTVWALHNHNVNKLSAIYESIKTGNSYLMLNYKRMPSTVFQELFDYLDINNYLLVNEDDAGFDAVRATLKHAELKTILICPVKDFIDGKYKIIGLLSTSWKKDAPTLNKDLIDRFYKYANSLLVLDVVNIEICNFEINEVK